MQRTAGGWSELLAASHEELTTSAHKGVPGGTAEETFAAMRGIGGYLFLHDGAT